VKFIIIAGGGLAWSVQCYGNTGKVPNYKRTSRGENILAMCLGHVDLGPQLLSYV